MVTQEFTPSVYWDNYCFPISVKIYISFFFLIHMILSWSYQSVSRISPWDSPVKNGIYLTLSTRENLLWTLSISHTHFPDCPLPYSSNLCPNGQYPQTWSYHSVSRISPWDSPVKDGIYLKHTGKPIMGSIHISLSLKHTHTLSHTHTHTHTFQTVPFHTVPTFVPMDNIPCLVPQMGGGVLARRGEW